MCGTSQREKHGGVFENWTWKDVNCSQGLVGYMVILLKCGDLPTYSPSLGFTQHVRIVTLYGLNGVPLPGVAMEVSHLQFLIMNGSHGSSAKYSCNLRCSAGHRSFPRPQAAAEDLVFGSYEGPGETAGRLLQTKLP